VINLAESKSRSHIVYRCLVLTCGLFCAAAIALAQSGTAAVSSPDGRIAITFQTVEKSTSAPQRDTPAPSKILSPSGGQLIYSVSYGGKPLVQPSALRLHFDGQQPLGADIRLVTSAQSAIDETYTLVSGKTRTARNHCNTLRMEFEENGGPARKLIIEARAYDDAAAFRYIVPEQSAMSDFRLTKEATEFRISKDPFVYALFLPNYRSMYESEFIKLSASSLSNQGGVASLQLLGLPLLMEVPGVAWMAIDEADLRGTSAMYLVNPSGGWTSHKFESRLAPQVDNPGVLVSGNLPYQSAWRVLMIAENPGRLIESNILTSLNPPSQIQDVSWIKPGKASWNWWSGSIGPDGKPAFTTGNMKYYVDFAAKSGFEYMLVDAGWSARGDITKMNGRVDIPELVRYASSKNVRIWIWLSYTDAAKQMEQAFPLYEKWGVVGLKIDFVERDDQAGIDWYYRVAELAARHHLMLDFHGCTKPTGIERTWPNILGYEAVLGMEQSKAGSRDNPDHHVMLPFTRMLGGLMDYTPGGFNNVTKTEFEARGSKPMVMGTRAHHLAMYAIYEAPIQMVSDDPAAYEDQPSFQFIKDAPASWDETRVLDGAPGEYITMARRRGGEWFLGSMTNWMPRQIDIPLTFLGDGKYRAEIYADADDADRFPKNTSITRRIVDRNSRLTAHLAPAGGYAVRLAPVEP
jgi:alpha-glucosidase